MLRLNRTQIGDIASWIVPSKLSFVPLVFGLIKVHDGPSHDFTLGSCDIGRCELQHDVACLVEKDRWSDFDDSGHQRWLNQLEVDVL